jgi:hypothetical protein
VALLFALPAAVAEGDLLATLEPLGDEELPYGVAVVDGLTGALEAVAVSDDELPNGFFKLHEEPVGLLLLHPTRAATANSASAKRNEMIRMVRCPWKTDKIWPAVGP